MCIFVEQVVDLVEKQVEKRELNNWYEARLLSASPHEKGKKVYCYITPRVGLCGLRTVRVWMTK